LLGGSPRRCLEPVELGLASDQLGLALLDAVELGKGVPRDRFALGDLMLEILHTRGELARLSRELELALVQLPASSGHALVTPARSGYVRLALVQLRFSRLQLRA
jgi:hypothetical protein